jgi:hypothetical protein
MTQNVFGSPTPFKAINKLTVPFVRQSSPNLPLVVSMVLLLPFYGIIFLIWSFPLPNCSTEPFKNQMTNHIKQIRQNKILTVMVEWGARGGESKAFPVHEQYWAPNGHDYQNDIYHR